MFKKKELNASKKFYEVKLSDSKEEEKDVNDKTKKIKPVFVSSSVKSSNEDEYS